MSLNSELKKSIGLLKQMEQFGAGNTFQDLMASFSRIGEELVTMWPWVSFAPGGDIRCTVFPTDKDRGFELILVATDKVVRFPNEEKVHYKIKGIKQNVHVLAGRLGIEYEDRTEWIEEGQVTHIDPDTSIALLYRPGFFIFKQVPRIARSEDFTFEF